MFFSLLITLILPSTEAAVIDRKMLKLLLKEFEFWYLLVNSCIYFIGSMAEGTVRFNASPFWLACMWITAFNGVMVCFWIFVFDAMPTRGRNVKCVALLLIGVWFAYNLISGKLSGDPSIELQIGEEITSFYEVFQYPAEATLVVFIWKYFATAVLSPGQLLIIRSPGLTQVKEDRNRP
eukprot:TRINITY_DN12976_c0_g1_i1.p1 TRINITY_DN12976_c0_g1~~TRINITY_DN12976_c0_g1_i1.p1  ORF type:complete len:179 (-),score=21.48 TRINITY_DN12976_c0_g1_i1:116-652(-)